MGHRMNWLLASGGCVRVIGEHWGALGLPNSLLRGPRLVEYLNCDENGVRCTPSGDEIPYSSVWAEGGAVVDADRRILTFYSDINTINFSVALRRRFLPVLAAYWPGWEIRYAVRGLRDLLDQAGLPAGELIDPRDVRPLTATAVAESTRETYEAFGRRVSHAEHRRQVEPLGHYRGHDESVITVRLADGTVHDYAMHHRLDDILITGTDLLDMLAGQPTTPLPNELHAADGAFIDGPARTVYTWWAFSDLPGPTALKDAWPGWTIIEHTGGLPHQAELSGRDPEAVQFSARDLLAELCEALIGGSEAESAFHSLVRAPRRWNPGFPINDDVRAILHHTARTLLR